MNAEIIKKIEEEGVKYQYSFNWMNIKLREHIKQIDDVKERRKAEKLILKKAKEFYSIKLGIDEKVVDRAFADILPPEEVAPTLEELSKTVNTLKASIRMIGPKVAGLESREVGFENVRKLFEVKLDRFFLIYEDVEKMKDAQEIQDVVVGTWEMVKRLDTKYKTQIENLEAEVASLKRPWYKRLFGIK